MKKYSRVQFEKICFMLKGMKINFFWTLRTMRAFDPSAAQGPYLSARAGFCLGEKRASVARENQTIFSDSVPDPWHAPSTSDPIHMSSSPPPST